MSDNSVVDAELFFFGEVPMPRVTRLATKTRRKKEIESRRHLVLDAAEAVFQADGYQAATVDKIAEQAGVSVGTVYNFFGSKEKVYAKVIERVAEQMLSHVKQSILPLKDPELAIELLVRFRLSNFERHRLFLVLFSSERTSGAYPDAQTISLNAKDWYYRYLDLIADIFEGGMKRGAFQPMHPLHLALSFEGVLSAFVGYLTSPGKTQSVEEQARLVRDTFIRMAGLKRSQSGEPVTEPEAERRDIYVTSFDFARLKELIAVARGFGGAKEASHLNELESELTGGKIVQPTMVPGDVVTMNSRVRLTDLSTSDSVVRCLVFPVDVDKGPENLSILDPLGTALLGRRVGAVLEVAVEDKVTRYKVAELLYQPESAGDYHR